MTKKITEKDKKDFSKKSLNLSKLEDTIDLHGYSLENANKIISEFIKVSFNKGTKKLNVITGKGTRSKEKLDPYKSETLSLLKYSVPEYIKSNSELMLKIKSINFENINDPSKGSFEIFLKKIKF